MDTLFEKFIELLGSKSNEAATAFIILLTITSAIRLRTKSIDQEISQEKRDDIALSLMGVQQDGLPKNWANLVAFIFNKFFGNPEEENTDGNKFIRSSMIISLICYFFFFLILITTDNREQILNELELISISIIVISIVLNLSKDIATFMYASIFINKNYGVIGGILLTFLPSITCYFFYYIVIVTLSTLSQDFFGVQFKSIDFIILIIPFFTTLVATCWVILNYICLYTYKLLTPVVTITKWLNIEEAPIKSIGTIINIYIWALGILFIGIQLTLS